MKSAWKQSYEFLCFFGIYEIIVAIVVVTTMTMSTLTITKFLRKGIQDGWAAARALATEYNDQYMHDS